MINWIVKSQVLFERILCSKFPELWTIVLDKTLQKAIFMYGWLSNRTIFLQKLNSPLFNSYHFLFKCSMIAFVLLSVNLQREFFDFLLLWQVDSIVLFAWIFYIDLKISLDTVVDLHSWVNFCSLSLNFKLEDVKCFINQFFL
jgi:hypothetical protein